MIKRHNYLDQVKNGFGVVPIVILIGARQVGKTSLMKMYEFEGSKLFLNGQDPEVASLFEHLSQLETYLKIYLDEALDGLLLIDEFQFIPRVSTMLKLLTDKHERLKVLCSGSSSIDIFQHVEESLAGRLRMVEVFSLSFAEYLLFNDEKLYQIHSSISTDEPASAFENTIAPLLDEYLVYGGLPRAAKTKDPRQKLAILDDIYKTYLLRDVRTYIKNEHTVGFNKLLRLLALQTGNLLNINELSRETGLSYRNCVEYVELLQQMYIIKLAEPYHTNKRTAITKMKKVYFCDTGLRNIINSDFAEIDFRPDNGVIFENYVFLELLRNLNPGGEIRFYRTRDGAEVDFIVNQVFERWAVECKYKTLDKPSHSKALTVFSEMEQINKRFLINKNLNISDRDVKFVQGYLAGKIG
ncbi:MAG: ATP-binding protein [Bacteroidetes bacterium]|nr:ATP-binding protein [Bacteroidota bacterium]MBU1580708.1 ATP-binding protein [Bacteroidota bacterium]MBU2464739.1 ATP-binding protein [Bacteroidota bacterium]MBU2558116.1 ATP-binding protein [Bacteroidota bacterium]